jgi:hypothetical protein
MTENNELTIRKLTPRECLRLQGYNDDEIDRLADAKDTNGKPLFPKTKLKLWRIVFQLQIVMV